MRILRTFFISLLLVNSASSQQPNSDKEHDQLLGPVKTVRIEKVKLVNKAGKLVEGKRTKDRSWHYDKNGNLIDEVIGSNHRLYSHDSKGNRLEKRNPNIIMGGAPDPTDFNNQVRADDGSLLYKWILKYDTQGNRTEEDIYLGDRELSTRYVYAYDVKGHRIETKRYDSQGSVTHRWVYNYDTDGKIKEQIEYEGGTPGISTRFYDYQFDSRGNWIKATISKLVKKKGLSSFEPVEVAYRVITYY